MPHVTLPHTVHLPHGAIHYRELGPADSTHPPVVFVHGMLVDHRLWLDVARRLADQGYRCLLPDWPLGSHTTAVTDRSRQSPAGVAETIHDFLVALDLHDVTLVGNDTGGGLCQFLIDAHPERIGRLVLTNCDAFDKFPPFPFNAVFATLRGPRSIKALFTALKLKALRHSPLGFGLLADADPALTASWVAPARDDARIAGDLAAMLRNVARTDLTHVAPRLHNFPRPVTVVWGTADRCFTPELGRRLAALFPHSSFIEVPGARTFVPIDNPTAVVQAIATVGATP
ncbi:alpha/beta hydrolase [Mycobacterium sp. MS1601]|uniref:alpha/beta fold hydrolase n=1 Tax=Mycobacterium sp. MS1601 TaxID=1936029 RepID=UPI0009795FB0|nr:alpha/beta hydrolase [Mycobacterium sp. MS1601]AQA03843.1 alpha/beta hydrolase [Mycobacterium sp. MS1601]